MGSSWCLPNADLDRLHSKPVQAGKDLVTLLVDLATKRTRSYGPPLSQLVISPAFSLPSELALECLNVCVSPKSPVSKS